MTSICWNEAKTVGIICEDDQLAYELRKGAMNPLGIVSSAFMDAWGDMTADDNCTIEKLDNVDLFTGITRLLIAQGMMDAGHEYTTGDVISILEHNLTD